MVKSILSLYDYFSRRKVLLWSIFGVLTVLLAIASLRIGFREDISAFLPENVDGKRINEAYRHIGGANKLLTHFCMPDTARETNPELLISAVEYFVSAITEKDTSALIRKIDSKADRQHFLQLSQFLVGNMPYFLTGEDYLRMDSLITEDNIRRQLNEAKRILTSPAGYVLKQNLLSDPLHFAAPLLSRLRDFSADGQYDIYDDYIFTKDRRKALVTIESAFSPSETRNNAKLMEIIKSAVEDTQANFHHEVVIKYFGPVDFAVTNAGQIKKDIMVSMTLALVLILLLLVYTFRSIRSILIIILSLVFGWVFAFGVLAVFKAEISLIAVGIGSVIIGVAVNYPLHFLDHYRHERNIKEVFRHIVAPLVIGNITTVGAFLSLVFINSEAMRDLGMFASFLLFGTIAFVLLFLPHLLRKNFSAGQKKNDNQRRHIFNRMTFRNPVKFAPEKNKWFIGVIILLSVVFCILSFGTKFDTNMQNINYMTDAQKQNFAEMLAAANKNGRMLYCVAEGNTMEDALTAYESSKKLLDELHASGEISKISGIGNYLPSQKMQRERIEQWERFRSKHPDMISLVDGLGKELGFKPGTFDTFAEIIRAEYTVHEADYFSPLIRSFASNYIIDEPGNCKVINILHVPEQNTGSPENRLSAIGEKSFVFDAGTISRIMVNTLTDDFNKVWYMCGFIVFFFLLFTLGRIELSLLAFLPLMVGWFWILGIMNIIDIRFNIVNIILATLIFGQGDDYAIFITEGLMYEYACGKRLLTSYKRTIILSAAIMFTGIGSLIIAKHPALHSLAEVTVTGMVSVVLMTFIFPPAIFRWLTMKKGKKRLMPVTLGNFLATVYSFVVFLAGCAMITAAGFFLLTICKRTRANKMRYHCLLCKTARFVLNNIPRVKARYENIAGETFEKPSVIICNHQSHLDLMCIIMLSPKIIILTSEWVWMSPFYGQLVRYAYYYPVANGIESAMDKLKAAVEEGYSIMLFPEGTRSEDCSILRFHKGAFFLAEQLQLDIIPAVIHGVGHLLPKSELMLRKGEIHIRVLERIAPDDNRYGTTYSEKAKNIRRYYVEQYSLLAGQVETPAYYADSVRCNYIYKGPSVERAVRARLKRNNNYQELVGTLSGYGRVLVKNCGYGEFALLLALVCRQMTVVATDDDEERLAIASNCASIPDNLSFVPSVMEPEYRKFDRIVIMNGDNGNVEPSVIPGKALIL
jgi:1-acyl-sn-glycerol-3-phosphate acyltransferase